MNYSEGFASKLKQADLKITKARVTILTILQEKDCPVDVETIQHGLKHHHVRADQATIYRNLDTLAQSHLINRIDFQEGKFRYELHEAHHHHLVCDVCGK